MPQNCLKVPRVYLYKAPRKSFKVPHLFQAATVVVFKYFILARSTLSLGTGTSNMVSQVTPSGVSRCIHMCLKNLLFQ